MVDVEKFDAEFKFFKNIYSQINIADNVTFIGKNNSVYLKFSKDSSYYLLEGEIDADCEFLKWIKENEYCINMSLSEINLLGKMLKKNMIGVIFDGDKVEFQYLEDNGEPSSKCFTNKKIDYEKYTTKYNLIHNYKLSDKDLEDDVLEIYLDGETPTSEMTNDKLIEIATTKLSIKSLLKQVKNYIGKGKEKEEIIRIPDNYLLYSDTNELKHRYIGLESKITCDEYKLTLCQICLAI